MRNLLSTVLLLICSIGLSQNLKYYRPGQRFSSAENSCLLIKNTPALPLELRHLEQAAEFKTVKLSGFNDLDDDLDSLLNLLSVYLQPEVLILEHCDIPDMDGPIGKFQKLKKLQLLSCDFYENSLFHSLRSSSVATLAIQQAEPVLLLDSLVLVPQLQTLQLSNTHIFSGPTNIEQLRTTDGRNIDIAYYGSFYKPAAAKSVAGTSSPAFIADNTRLTGVRLDCIRQPIPGIDINDTVYRFSSFNGASFRYESGSNISVDRNAFLTMDGNSYAGQVQLFYREFRNPVEIMLSGIPMTNEVAGKTELFKSGGMYEMNAYDTKGNPLTTRSDTSIKINFALSDTSENFKFYSLNNNGTWNVQQDKITVSTKPQYDSVVSVTDAVADYYDHLRKLNGSGADTTDFESRFASETYLYTYRKDNLRRSDKGGIVLSPNLRKQGLFRVKYIRANKEGDIFFTIVQTNAGYANVPKHVRPLLNKTYLYGGMLDKEEFRKKFNRKLRCWDLRLNSAGNTLAMDVKTDTAHLELSGTPVGFRKDRSYYVERKGGVVLTRLVQRSLMREARLFNKKPKTSARYSETRFSFENYNNVRATNVQRNIELAFQHCKPFQNAGEKEMDLEAWKKYVRKFSVGYSEFQLHNTVGDALLKSGLGVKNIDAYLHKGLMEEIYVRYDGQDQLPDEYNAVLFEKINTSLPVSRSMIKAGYLQGLYFKKGSNYLIRFSEDGFMQVTRPGELGEQKKKGKINLAYKQEYHVKDLNSRQITRLIFD